MSLYPHGATVPRWIALLGLVALFASGCATLPPRAEFPKSASTALSNPEATRLGKLYLGAARAHDGKSGYRIISAGLDGLSARVQMIDAAERTLDLQYYVYRSDKTGRLVTGALIRAADRGVRVRVLVDEGERKPGDEELEILEAHPRIEVRLFNPFAYRGHSRHVRALEFLLNAPRLDYRMHNKLFVVDNAVALIGGRNIGDEYFQVDPDFQYGDDDVFVAGPVVPRLSATFDEYWNSALSIPARAFHDGRVDPARLEALRVKLAEHRRSVANDAARYLQHIASDVPFARILDGSLPLVWTDADLVYDSPDKRAVDRGERPGLLIYPQVMDAVTGVREELLVVTPFFVPGPSGVKLLCSLTGRGARVRVLTNSLEANPEILAHAGYVHYRHALLECGVELYEVRAQLGNASGSGQSRATVGLGGYSLHAKLFVFDRARVLIGSINFDLRSAHRNTEIGLILDSPALAQQTAQRFEALVQPANSYAVRLRDDSAGAELVWRTEENGQPVEYDREPGSAWRRLKADLASLLPLDPEL